MDRATTTHQPISMVPNALTLANIANQVNFQFERLMMLQELTRLSIESLPNSTDSDVPLALLNGMQEILIVDAAKLYRLFEDIDNQSKSASA